jgi:hypothetical protein
MPTGFAVDPDAGDAVPAGGSGETGLAVEIPGGAGDGRYAGDLTVAAGDRELTLPMEVAVRTAGGLPGWLPYAVGAGVVAGGGALGYRYLSSRGGPEPHHRPGGAPPSAEGHPNQPRQASAGGKQGPQGQQNPDGQQPRPPQSSGDPAPQERVPKGHPERGVSGSGGDAVATVACPNCSAPNLAESAVCGACGHQFR